MKFKYVLIILFVLLINIAAVCAYDGDNTTLKSNSYDIISNDDALEDAVSIEINSTKVYTGSSIEITCKDSNNTPIYNQSLTANINNKNYSLVSDNDGKSVLNLNVPAKKYVLNVIFTGGKYSSFNKTFNVAVLKINTLINPINTTVLNGNYLHVSLTDDNKNPLRNTKTTLTVNGKTYNSNSDSKGIAKFKISLAAKKYSAKISFAGNSYYSAISKSFTLLIPATTSLVIGNNRLLTNGYLRIYLKSDVQSAVSKKTIHVTVGNKSYNKTTNSEGIIIFKPKMGVGSIKVTVSYAGTKQVLKSSASKNITGIKGNTKSPLKYKIPLKNGVPDVDYMPGKYAMADEDMTYTLLKVQYREVLKRDSYCLYLNKKLSKYTFFKSKAEPKLNHIIKREKWNVIEREFYKKIEYPNKINYWPSSITADLKGKNYTYSEIRDPQDTGYTCGPTSASMCTQVLRSFICEKQLAKQAGTVMGFGTKCPWIKKALEKNNFKCSYFYKSTFNSALKQLAKGGCALVFHTYNHYVAIMDISKDGKKVLVGNPAKNYPNGKYKIPSGWISVNDMKTKFNNYDTRSLIVKLKYSLSKSTKTKINYIYSSMGSGWIRKNTAENIMI